SPITGGSAANTATAFTQLKAMPIPRTSSAPLFDGKYVNDFISTLEHHARVAGLADTDITGHVIRYCTDEVKRVIRYSEELQAKDWNATKQMLLDLYGAEDQPSKISLENLRTFIRETARGREFTTRAELDAYHRGYVSIAAQLKHDKVIDANEMKLKFIAGLPKKTREFVIGRLPDHNKQVNTPPEIREVITIINYRFDTAHLESLNLGFGEQEDDDEVTPAAIPASNSILPNITPVPSVTTNDHNSSISRPHQPRAANDIDSLTQQLQQLSLNQAQLQQMLQNALSLSANNSRPLPNTNRSCFICGQTNTHRLHPRHCPETPKLIDEGLMRFDSNRDRYVLADGADLPQVPYGMTGGVAQFLRSRRPAGNRRDEPPHLTVNASPVSLFMGDNRALQGSVYAIASNKDEYSPSDYEANPVTRSGRDTEVRFDPTRKPVQKRPTTSIPRAPHSSGVPPVQPTQPLPSQHQPTQINRAIDAPLPPAINTREGYKNATPAPKRDVQMKDGEPGKKNQYRFTSNIQDQVSVEAVQDLILQNPVILTLKQILALSPGLQKKMAESTKTRREYVTQSGEYDLYSDEAAEFLSQMSTPSHVEPAHSLVANDLIDDSLLDTFVLRYSNAVHFKPTKMFAMTTGTFVGTIGGFDAKFLVDTGSELNIFPERVLKQTSLALDHAGSRWSLKGVNGGPEGMRGVCQDVPITVGGHRFDHHFFVIAGEMDAQDCILGQPWLQWFAARIDLYREGAMQLVLWKDGNRNLRPTLSIQLAKPDDPRNVDSL
ncbi:hypothetical protein BJ165DRAFT_1325135, partial [Panaeolus papilionaceus]